MWSVFFEFGQVGEKKCHSGEEGLLVLSLCPDEGSSKVGGGQLFSSGG